MITYIVIFFLLHKTYATLPEIMNNRMRYIKNNEWQ